MGKKYQKVTMSAQVKEISKSDNVGASGKISKSDNVGAGEEISKSDNVGASGRNIKK